MLRRSVLSFALVVVAAEAGAQPAVGPEFRINSYTMYSQFDSAVAADANGNFVVAWTSDYQDGDYFGIVAQRFDRFGTPRGPEFVVNTYTVGYQAYPSVAVAPSGAFIISWEDPDGDGYGIVARRFDAGGTALGPEFPVNAYYTGEQFMADVAALTDGSFVVAWASYGQDGDGSGVFRRRFGPTGTAIDLGDVRVNTYTLAHQFRPAVATGPNGDFVVTWTSYSETGPSQDGDVAGVFGQRFAANGTAVGGEFRVNTYTSYWQDDADVAVDADGNFTVVWDSELQDGSSYGVFGQRFDASGAPLGPEFRINTYTLNLQATPTVAVEPGGHFVVTWISRNQAPGAADDVFARRFDPADLSAGAAFRVNTYTTGNQRAPTVASLGKETFVVTWTSDANRDGDGHGVFGQRFGDLIERDGFESGDLSGWSSAATDGGDLTVAPGAALNGSNFGLSAFVDDTSPVFVQDDTPNDERVYRARFYIDASDFDPGEALNQRRTRVFIGFEESPTRRVLAVVLRRVNGEYGLLGRARQDDNSQADVGFFPITPAEHFVEIRWAQATAPGANNGLFELWVDDALQGGLANVDNDQAEVDFVRMGGLSLKSAASGTLFFDGFDSRRETHIGP